LTAIFPRTGKRASFTAQREAGSPSRITLSGDIAGTLVTDGSGRMLRLELPAQQTTVSRAE
jgi:hypothetical protein